MAGGIAHTAVAVPGVLSIHAGEWNADHVVPEGAVAGVVPIGGILLWSGAIATIPAHWALCDGTLNAPGPDLRNTFVVGAQQDQGGVAKTNIEGSLKVSATQTGTTIADHTALTHTGAAVGDHTGLSHDGSVANHPDLTHAALSHAALTVVHADHSVASASHTHASGADVSVPSGSVASALASRPAVSHSHASLANASTPSGSFASGVDVSVPSGSTTAPSIAGVSSFATSTNRSGLTAEASHSHPVAAVTASRPSGSIASNAAVSVPSTTGTDTSGVDVSVPSGTIASTAGASRPSATGSGAAATLTHADHSLASLSHQAIGTHLSTAVGTHAFTPPAAHGAAGTLTHSFTEPSVHTISAHGTIGIVPAYYALAYIQRMA